MTTQEEIRTEIDRALEEDRIEDAEALGELLVPISAEEFLKRMNEAPLDEEPVTQADRESFDRAWAIIRGTTVAPDRRHA